MRCLALAWLLPVAISCGRTAPVHLTERHDAALLADGSASRDPPRDAPTDPPPDRQPADVVAERLERDLLTDAEARDLGGVDPPGRDASTADRADSGNGTSCSALQTLADRVMRQRTRAVTFAADRSWMVLEASAPGGAGSGSQLVRVALPSGETTTISSAGDSAEALGHGGAILVVGRAGTDQRLAVYENGVLRTVATGVCAHLATPDGSRIYLIRDCDRANRGTLDVVDMASRQATTLASHVLGVSREYQDFAVSPNGDYFAFLVQSPDGGTSSNVLHVADRGGRVYGLSSQPAAQAPRFVSDELLLFAVRGGSFPLPDGELRAHRPGTGDASYIVATERATGLFGYRISADGTWLLGAGPARGDAGKVFSASLCAIHLDGTGENLLSNALLPYWAYEQALDVFDWSGDGSRAIYVVDRDAGAGIWANDVFGASAVQLSPGGRFRTAPVGDLVAVLEDTGDARQNRLRVLALGGGAEIASFATDGRVAALDFVPDGRGLLFVSVPSSGIAQLRYVSASVPESVVLGEWRTTRLDMYPSTYGGLPGRYPVDPTGCFTVVDTDLAPGPGTRLVLLPE